MPRRLWLKFLFVLLLGFWLGIVLGLVSSFLMYYCLPASWLENGFKDRRARHERFVEGRRCRKSGFTETFDARANALEICACWPDGVGSPVNVDVTCSRLQLSGYGELGVG